MRSRLTKTVASMDGNDVAPLVSASALRDATNVSAQNAVAQMMSRAKPDIIFSLRDFKRRRIDTPPRARDRHDCRARGGTTV